MRRAPVLTACLLAVLAGCGAFGGVGSAPEPTPTLTPAAVPTVEPTPNPAPTTAATPSSPESAPVLIENARDREYVITLSAVEGPVTTVEVVYADGRTVVVDPSADPSTLDERLAAGTVVDVRIPMRAGTERYRVAPNGSFVWQPFAVLSRATPSTSVVWVVEPAGENSTVTAAGIDPCAPPHSLVTEFRVRVLIGVEHITVDCA